MASSQHQEIKTLMTVSALFLLPLLAMATARPIKHPDTLNCWYVLFVATGDYFDAGTDSEVSVTMFDNRGNGVEIPDLKQYGTLGPTWPYFQSGNLDVFIVSNTTCLVTEACRMILHIEDTGTEHDWYCDAIGVIATLKNDTLVAAEFPFEQGLTPGEPDPIIDHCTGSRDGNAHAHAHNHGHALFQSILRNKLFNNGAYSRSALISG